jgi:RNA polymerase sigma-70 factor, ECF subfamily
MDNQRLDRRITYRYSTIYGLKRIHLMYILLMMIITDAEFRLLKTQDQTILGKIFHMYQRDLYNFLLVKTKGNDDLTHDLLSDTFLSAYDSAPRLKFNKNLKSWLFKIAYRRLIDYRRKQFRDNKYLKIKQELKQPPEAIEERIHRKQKALLFSMALKKLNPDYQEIFRLKYKEEKSIKEIAAILKKKEMYVINKINRAKAAIKREMFRIARDFFEESE